MSYEQARRDIEARYESGLLSFMGRDAEIEALEYEVGERLAALEEV